MLRKGARSLLIVIVLALLAGFLAMGVVSKARNTAPCLVASRALQAGTRLDEKAVEVKEIPAAAILPGQRGPRDLCVSRSYSTVSGLAALEILCLNPGKLSSFQYYIRR